MRLDAKDYIQIKPTDNTNNYFLAAPATELAVFIAQPLDGCGGKTVARPTIQQPNSFVIYPNPAKESFTVFTENNAPIISLEIFDMNGRRIISLQKITSNKAEINCNR